MITVHLKGRPDLRLDLHNPAAMLLWERFMEDPAQAELVRGVTIHQGKVQYSFPLPTVPGRFDLIAVPETPSSRGGERVVWYLPDGTCVGLTAYTAQRAARLDISRPDELHQEESGRGNRASTHQTK